jgi:AcrR family transcriptional regulator
VIPTPATAGNVPVEEEDDEQSDGRRLRAARNRDAVVSAVLDIIREQGGGPIPGAAEVAERAGVSERTVFRHFADLDSLFLAAAQHQRPVLASYLVQRPDAKELDKRIAAIVRLRARMYQDIGAIRRIAVRLAEEHESVARVVNEANRAGRAQLADVFAPELKQAGREKAMVLDQLELLTSWGSWDTLRRELQGSPDRARKIMTAMMTTVLAPYARRSRR